LYGSILGKIEAARIRSPEILGGKMINLFFGFSGRLRRRDFILWSILVPIVLVVPPVVAVASTATSTETSLVEDLAAAGVLWPFFILVLLSNYVSVALFWKRMQDVDEQRQRQMWAGFTRWAYAVMTGLNAILIGLNLLALGKLEGSASGFVIFVFWSMACWLGPHRGSNSFGPDPRDGSASAAMDDTPTAASLQLDAAMQRALAERNAHASAVVSPKLARPAKPAPAAPAGKPSFGRRGA
jgi:uncharacterized membrane protein YhaH (DUF805 family)